VDEAEHDAERCFRENSEGAAILAAQCARTGSVFLTFSSDLVFDGSKTSPYVESDSPCPLNVYGKTKAEAESRVLDLLPSSLIIRTSAFFSPWDEYNFVHFALRTIAEGQRFRAAADAVVSPTYVPDLVEGALDLLIDEECGIFHLANQGEVSWAEFAAMAARHCGLSTEMIEPVTSAELNLPAARPMYSALRSERAWIMPSLESALDRFAGSRQPQSVAAPETTAAAD
jgi:dTDP-4-dehydrorhamnose reductase